ncbi:elongation factor G [Amycolatopsis benzoatilytica]|uniref:elongation factor G n=1 Tax=Amycolatopsis benzoatilytica TaxID=346045 RepID=UPI00037F2582|nr:TetM/TetW/TetO/TetS family tetracycline resistance ribosomal protection protein [Amycolatopsis benzoatilytica]
MKALTIGVLAHVDAGKTSLTERLLFETGVLDHVGSVDDGDTQTDSLELERRRGITIKSAVVAVSTPGHRLTLVDTPGHADFIAEVERAVAVLDGAVLVVSAVEGVQAQTRVLMRTLVRLGIPSLVFVNKIDRAGARSAELLESLRTKLSPRCVPMSTGSAVGTADATVFSLPFAEHLADALADDERFLESYVAGEVSEADYRAALTRQVAAAQTYPVYFGSAVTGAGVAELVAGIYDLLPARERTAEGPLDAAVFKIERGRGGEKIAYARVFSGSLAARRPVPVRRRTDDGIRESTGRPSAVRVFEHGSAPVPGEARAGEVAKVWGLPAVRIGDRLGPGGDLRQDRLFAPPSLETLVRPADPAQNGELYAALSRLSEQDPLISIRRRDNAITVHLYGEVQKEVIQTTLAEEFGVVAEFEGSRPLLIERLHRTGHRVRHHAPDERVFFWATVGLRVEPAPPGTGVDYRLAVELGSLPLAFHNAIEETVREILREGPHGREIPDCVVTLTDTGYFSPVTTAGDFRGMTELVLREALEEAGTQVYEPIHTFELEAPAAAMGAVLRKLAEFRAIPEEPAITAERCTVDGRIPATAVPGLEQAVPALTQGEGTVVTAFAEYRLKPNAGGPRRAASTRRGRPAD